MTAALCLSAVLLQAETATVSYGGVPAEAERVVVSQWRQGAQPAALDVAVIRHEAGWSITGPPGTDVTVSFVRGDGAYLLDGPLRWPGSAASRSVDRRWRRSVRIPLAAGVPPTLDFEWIAADGSRDAWPACIRDGRAAAICHGVPVDHAGVAYLQAYGHTWWSVVTPEAVGAMHVSGWSRMLVVRSAVSQPLQLRAAIEQPVAPTQRLRSVRMQKTTVARAGAVLVPPAAIWVYGEQVPQRAWIDVRAARAGPVHLSLDDVAGAPAELPVFVTLDAARSVEGAVLDANGSPAGGTLITVFRLLSSSSDLRPSRDREPASRVFVAEAIAGPDGGFAIDGLGAADYEIVAWHPQRGRASMALDGRTRVEIRLESTGTIRGRALSAGKPAAGVDVISVPDPAAARDARDVLDLAGGNVRTGPDGRFVVPAAPAGGGELRIGGGAYPIRRIPLPRESVRAIDLGDVELGTSIAITVSLDVDPGCDLRAAGPIGKSGLLLVAAARAGPGLFRVEIPEEGHWEFTLSCGGVERALSPAVRQITSALAGKEVQFAVR